MNANGLEPDWVRTICAFPSYQAKFRNACIAKVVDLDRYWVADGEGYKLVKDKPIDEKRLRVENPEIDSSPLPTFPPSGRQ